MILKKTNAKFTNPIERVGKPDFSYQEDSMTVHLYFIDEYDWKDEALQKQLFYIDRGESTFSILIEKEIYNEIPEYYSKESLLVMAQYFRSLSNKNISLIGIGGVLLTLISILGLNYFLQNIFIATLASLAIGTFYMVFILFRILQNNIYKSRLMLRENLVRIFGEEKLDAMLDKLDAYMERRQKELS